jgi:hypothetical protein
MNNAQYAQPALSTLRVQPCKIQLAVAQYTACPGGLCLQATWLAEGSCGHQFLLLSTQLMSKASRAVEMLTLPAHVKAGPALPCPPSSKVKDTKH